MQTKQQEQEEDDVRFYLKTDPEHTRELVEVKETDQFGRAERIIYMYREDMEQAVAQFVVEDDEFPVFLEPDIVRV